MLNISIVAVGKMKNKNLAGEAGEYLKRLGPFARIKIEELAAEPFRQASDKAKVKKSEAEKLSRALLKYPGAQIIALDERGSEMNTREFSELAASAETGQLVFVIGGTLGYDQDFLRDKKTLALSRLTLTHEQARLLLLEQIYRGACINTGKDYHY